MTQMLPYPIEYVPASGNKGLEHVQCVVVVRVEDGGSCPTDQTEH